MACILLAGCSDDGNGTPEEVLKVVSSEVSFDCLGGTGTIQVRSALPISATSSEEWCQVSVSATTVSVTVSANRLIGSRTALVTILAGEEETQVPVYQLGDIFDTDMKDTDFPAAGGEVTFRVKSNWEVRFEAGDDASWCSYDYSAEEQQVTIRVLPLQEQGQYRRKTIRVQSGTHEVTAAFTQVNLAGQYACYVNQGRTAYGTCLLEETDRDFYYTVTPTGSAYDAPYQVRYRNGQLVISFGQYLGEVEHSTHPYVYLCAYDKAGRLTWGSSVEYVAPVDVTDTEGRMLLFFADNGTWSGQQVDGFYYGLFDNLLEQGGSTTGLGLSAIVDLVWLKMPD